MKQIKIYLVANEVAVEQDKQELESFVQELNNKYNKVYEIYFDLINDENFKNLDEDEIKNSELFYILFCNEMDKQSVDKFNVAYNSFMQNLTPKITTYIKNSDKPAGKSVNEFLEKIDTELGHYHSVYNNVDTIKLNLILKLQNLELQLGDLKTEDGKLFIGNQEIMSIENIPIILNNNDLNSLKTELQKLEEKYWKLRDDIRKAEINENEEDTSKTDALIEEYRQVSSKRKKAKEDIFELEKNIIELENSLVKMSTKGKLSQRQIYAKKCLDQGKIQEAKQALNFEEIKADAEKILQFKESKKDELRININELIQRVDTLKLDITNENRFKEIEQTYEEAIRIEKEGGLYRETLVEYAIYLFKQNRFQKSIEYAEQFLKYADVYGISEEETNIFRAYNLLGLSCTKIQLYAKAENCYLEMIEIREKLVESKSKIYNEELAMSYNNIANLYIYLNSHNQAEEYYKKSVEILIDLSKDRPKQYVPELAALYNNIGVLNKDANQYSQAEEYYKKAIEIREKIAQENPEMYNNDLARSYNNIANVYRNIKQYNRAEEYYKKAIEIREKLARENPEAHEGELANLYSNIAILNKSINQYNEAKKYYAKTIEIRKSLAQENPKAYSKKLANTYNNIAILYYDIKQYIQAEEYYKKAIEINEKVAQFNPKVPNRELSMSYNNIAVLYDDIKQYNKAEEYYIKAIEIKEKLAKQNPRVDNNNLTISYNNMANLYDEINQSDKAKEYREKAAKLEQKQIRIDEAN